MLAGFPQRFEILGLLGEGGMGVVYEVFDRVRGETVALKTIRKADGDAIYRLKREFRALANLEHPNLVRLYDLFVEGESCFFTMELVVGAELASYVAAGQVGGDDATLDSVAPRPFDEAALRHVLEGLVRGLAALHGAGLLHRDLKPSNVLVTPQGRVVVLDFGLVADAHASVQQTQAGSVAGTVTYMAPEQARGEAELTTAADLYALGVILYELLTGRPPFDGPALKVLVAKQIDDPTPPSRLLSSVPADLDALAMGLLSRDPLARPRVDEVLRRVGSVRSSRASRASSSNRSQGAPLLGRDRELGALLELYRKSREGRPALALVRAPSGLGKSALLHAFVRHVEKTERAVVLAGGCYEWESVPYKGLDGVIDALSRELSLAGPEKLLMLLPPDIGALGALFPVLRRIKPIATAYVRERLSEKRAERIRTQGFECLREILFRLGADAPLVVAVDDVQWADDDTARGLLELLQGERAPAMLLLLAARPTDDAPVLGALFREHASSDDLPSGVIDLAPLSPSSMRALAERELGQADEAMIDAIAREAAGVPFAVGELARFLREGEVDASGTMREASIDEVVRSRAAMLDREPRRLLDAVSIAGEPMPADLLLRAAGLAEDDRAPVDVLRVRHFVRTVRIGTATLLHTAHNRIRESIVAALDPDERAEGHRSLAVAMELLEKPPHEKLARHFAAAAENALGRHHALEAAKQATAAFAFRRAVDFYALALSLSTESERPELLDAYAEALASAGRYADSAEVWGEAARRATGTGARERKRRAAESWLYAGRIDQGLDLLDEVVGELGVRIPSSRLAVIFQIIRARLSLFFRGLRPRLRSPAEIGPGELEKVRTLGAVAAQYSPIDPFRGLIPVTRYLLAALDLGEVNELALALGIEGASQGAFGRAARAEKVARTLDQLDASSGGGRAAQYAAVARAMSAIFSGRLREGNRLLDGVLAAMERSPTIAARDLSLVHYVEGFHAVSGLAMERLERLLRAAEEREEQTGPYGELRLRVVILPNYHLRIGRPDLARAIADEGFWRSATRREVTFRSTAEMYASWASLYEGDVATAEERIRRARVFMMRSGAWGVSVARGTQLVREAAVALATGRPEWARETVRAFGRPRDDYQRAFVHALRAAAALTEGDDHRARRELTAWRDLGAANGYASWEATACFALARLAPGDERAAERSRYEALVTGCGFVDPDRFFWSQLPVGEAPPRTGRRS